MICIARQTDVYLSAASGAQHAIERRQSTLLRPSKETAFSLNQFSRRSPKTATVVEGFGNFGEIVDLAHVSLPNVVAGVGLAPTTFCL